MLRAMNVSISYDSASVAHFSKVAYTPGFYVEKQRSARTLFYFFTELRFTLDLTGKAEASSAGEQLARNNLFDWNGQKRLG